MTREGSARVLLCTIVCLASVSLASCGDDQSPPVKMLINGPRGAGVWRHADDFEQDSGSTAYRIWLQGGDDFAEEVHAFPSISGAETAFKQNPPEKDEVYERAKEYVIGARMAGADQVAYKCGTWNEQSQCVTWWAWARYGRYTVTLTYRRPMRGTGGSLADTPLATMITNAGTDIARQYRSSNSSKN